MRLLVLALACLASFASGQEFMFYNSSSDCTGPVVSDWCAGKGAPDGRLWAICGQIGAAYPEARSVCNKLLPFLLASSYDL